VDQGRIPGGAQSPRKLNSLSREFPPPRSVCVYALLLVAILHQRMLRRVLRVFDVGPGFIISYAFLKSTLLSVCGAACAAEIFGCTEGDFFRDLSFFVRIVPLKLFLPICIVLEPPPDLRLDYYELSASRRILLPCPRGRFFFLFPCLSACIPCRPF